MESNPRRDSSRSCYLCFHNRKTEKATTQCKTCGIKCCDLCSKEHMSTTGNEHEIESIAGENQLEDYLMAKMIEKEMATINLSHRFVQDVSLLVEPPISVFHMNDVTVRVPDDVNDCYVTGCLAVENKQLLIVDKNNMKLKLFDSNGSHVTSAETPNVTWGITKLSPRTFATCGCGNEITLWELKEGNILQMKGITVYETAYGISNNSQCICTMHPSSDSLTLISRESEKVVGHKHFCNPSKQHISFGFDLAMDEYFAYVGCGLGDKKIVAISLIFKSITWEVQLPGNTCGVLDLRHQLLVTDMTNKKLVTVSKKGKILDTTISLDFMDGRPQYMGCSYTGRTLFVSQYRSDVITMFGLRLHVQ